MQHPFRRSSPLALLALLALALQGCAGGEKGPVLYSLEGPPLAIVGDQGGVAFKGRMERKGMLGQGQMALQSAGLVCADTLKSRPNQDGHIAAVLRCGESTLLMLTFRTLGPDQGIGLGRVMYKNGSTGDVPLIFYFHPWEEEAARRLEQEKNTLLGIIRQKETP